MSEKYYTYLEEIRAFTRHLSTEAALTNKLLVGFYTIQNPMEVMDDYQAILHRLNRILGNLFGEPTRNFLGAAAHQNPQYYHVLFLADAGLTDNQMVLIRHEVVRFPGTTMAWDFYTYNNPDVVDLSDDYKRLRNLNALLADDAI